MDLKVSGDSKPVDWNGLGRKWGIPTFDRREYEYSIKFGHAGYGTGTSSYTTTSLMEE